MFQNSTMPRHYVRKTTRQSWDDESMKQALVAVEHGTPYLTAAKQFNIPRNTLKRRHKNVNKVAKGAAKSLGSKQVTELNIK